MSTIRRALISVSDKSGLVPFVQGLVDCGIEILSTGGTCRTLSEAGLPVKEISDFTGFPEMLDGRVKTLHPRVHAGLLYIRGEASHEQAMKEHDLQPIDLVVVNLYPFEETVAREGVSFEDAIENIDIGGPSMLRSAAKNHASVTVITDPSDYESILKEIRTNGGTTAATRQVLALKVFQRTSAYDAAISAYLSTAIKPGSDVPGRLQISLPLTQSLRYGENPAQKAGLYGDFNRHFRQLHGKALSYNNILDLTAAAELITEFRDADPTLAILKHTNPCGVGRGPNLASAWENAFETDKLAPFGGIIAVNRPMDRDCAQQIASIFSEVIIAPSFEPGALDVLTARKNLRLIEMPGGLHTTDEWRIRSVGYNCLLMQERDAAHFDRSQWKVVTSRQPTDEEWAAMEFGQRVCKHVKSNAIVYVNAERTLGIGAGQMSRVDASRIAVRKASEAGLSLEGAVVCSDAFFPFADGLVAAAESGARAAIQPGGSVRDEEVIAAADKAGLAMVFTGNRHFRH
jgi:phosphoribosylaminoimidazolecarboxamide formyltransferase/IMP cyclohydrolase